MGQKNNSTIEVTCPCCGARLTIDSGLGKVLHHTAPPKQDKSPDLAHAAQLLENEKARREALFQQSTEDQKIKSDLLDRKFQEALKQTKDEPITRPTRDIDLD
jgi:predicted amidophosphoribosyltransferase